MAADSPMTREDLLALTPQVYLRNGYRTPDGVAWPELEGLWPLAAAEQLRAAGVIPSALDRAIGRALPALLKAQASARDGQGALLAVANEPGTPRPIGALFKTLAMAIAATADVAVAAQHLGAILRVLALDEALGKPPGEQKR